MATKDPRKAIKLHVQCTLYTHINWLVSIMQLCSPGILSLDSINCHLQNDKIQGGPNKGDLEKNNHNSSEIHHQEGKKLVC